MFVLFLIDRAAVTSQCSFPLGLIKLWESWMLKVLASLKDTSQVFAWELKCLLVNADVKWGQRPHTTFLVFSPCWGLSLRTADGSKKESSKCKSAAGEQGWLSAHFEPLGGSSVFYLGVVVWYSCFVCSEWCFTARKGENPIYLANIKTPGVKCEHDSSYLIDEPM